MINESSVKQAILDGDVILGIELGSTRIKSVLIDFKHEPIASGSHDWENSFESGMWTYPLDEVWTGLQASFSNLSQEVERQYGVKLSRVRAMGVSAMMHGYLVFNQAGEQLVPFRTWRNTTTEEAAERLSDLFTFNVPQRWSIAHLYQALLNKEAHVKDIHYMTTLAGYVHWQLTGEKVVGIGEASGMFPIDSTINDYDEKMIATFDALTASTELNKPIRQLLPYIRLAGDSGGKLTEAGARLLDPTGTFQSGVLLCPPEGDAGTGMVATNSVAEKTGNTSAGTSIFAMVVLEKALTNIYAEIDMVTTPTGKPVAMVHCNNCTSDLDAWVALFDAFARKIGKEMDRSELYTLLYNQALEGDSDGGGLLAYNYFAGEPITGLEKGRPLFVRMPDSAFTLSNFMRTLLFSSMGTLKLGMDILTEKEQVHLDQMYGHGGFFKVQGVGQRLMASAFSVPVTVMASAGEGGAWGIALLAAFSFGKGSAETLEHYLKEKVFGFNQGVQIVPNPEDEAGFSAFMKRYVKGLAIEKAAVTSLD